MVDKKITQLDELTFGSSGDFLPIVQALSGVTKKISYANLLQLGNRFYVTVGAANSDYITDGTADEVQINAAIAFVSAAGGGKVFIKAGTYNLAASVLMASNVYVFGEGIGVTKLLGANSDTPVLGTAYSGKGDKSSTQSKTSYSNIGLHNLTVVSQNGHAITLFNITGLNVTDIEVYFSATPSIRESLYILHCANVVTENCYVHDTAGNGIQLNACDYFSVANNIVKNTGDDAIDIDYDFLDTFNIPSRYGSVVGNVVDTITGGKGIRVENSHFVTVGNNVVGNSSSDGIWVGCDSRRTGLTCTNIEVNANVVFGCVTGGIKIEITNSVASTVENIHITNNLCYDNGDDSGSDVRGGIVIRASATSASVRTVVRGNRVNKVDKTGDSGGIVIYKVNNVLVSDNLVENAPRGIHLWNGDAAQTYTGIIFENNKSYGTVVDYFGASSVFNQDGVQLNQPYKGNYNAGNVTGGITLNVKNGDIQYATLTGDITVTLTAGFGRNQRLTLVLTQDASGNHAVTWPSNFKKVGGTLTLSTGANAVDIINMAWDGTNWREISRSLALS